MSTGQRWWRSIKTGLGWGASVAGALILIPTALTLASIAMPAVAIIVVVAFVLVASIAAVVIGAHSAWNAAKAEEELEKQKEELLKKEKEEEAKKLQVAEETNKQLLKTINDLRSMTKQNLTLTTKTHQQVTHSPTHAHGYEHDSKHQEIHIHLDHRTGSSPTLDTPPTLSHMMSAPAELYSHTHPQHPPLIHMPSAPMLTSGRQSSHASLTPSQQHRSSLPNTHSHSGTVGNGDSSHLRQKTNFPPEKVGGGHRRAGSLKYGLEESYNESSMISHNSRRHSPSRLASQVSQSSHAYTYTSDVKEHSPDKHDNPHSQSPSTHGKEGAHQSQQHSSKPRNNRHRFKKKWKISQSVQHSGGVSTTNNYHLSLDSNNGSRLHRNAEYSESHSSVAEHSNIKLTGTKANVRSSSHSSTPVVEMYSQQPKHDPRLLGAKSPGINTNAPAAVVSSLDSDANAKKRTNSF